MARTSQPSDEERQAQLEEQAARQAGLTVDQYRDQQRQLNAPDQQAQERQAAQNSAESTQD